MEIKRTANAGVLLKMDGKTILLDGVCKQLPPYEATPDSLRRELIEAPADILAFTHYHADHYDAEYAALYGKKTLRSVYGPEFSHSVDIGGIQIIPIKTRHIGKADVEHVSFIIKGSRCVWFMGDASPLEWKNLNGFPSPDVLIVPYAYAITDSAWKISKELGAKSIVLLHMPVKENDPYGLWEAVKKTTQGDPCLHIPEMGQILNL